MRDHRTSFWNMLTTSSWGTSLRSWIIESSRALERSTRSSIANRIRFCEKVHFLCLSKSDSSICRRSSITKRMKNKYRECKTGTILTESSSQLLSGGITHKLVVPINDGKSMKFMFRKKSFQFTDGGDAVFNYNDLRQWLHEIGTSFPSIAIIHWRSPGVSPHRYPNRIDTILTHRVSNPLWRHNTDHDG